MHTYTLIPSLVPDPLAPSCHDNAGEGLGSYRLPFMLLDDQTSSYVTKPRATNTISLIVILMCHTECLATDLTFHSYSTCFLSCWYPVSTQALRICQSLWERGLPLQETLERKSTPCLTAHSARLQMFSNRTRAS